MKVPKRKKDEPLYKWVERLMVEVPIRKLDDDDLYKLLRKVSIESYIAGANLKPLED